MSEPRPPRLTEGTDDMAKWLDAAREGAALPRPGSRQRVWKGLQAPAKSSPLKWLVPALAAAAAAAAVFVWTRPPQAAGTVALASGDVEVHAGQLLLEGTPLRTGANGRLAARLEVGDVVLHSDTRATLQKGELTLDTGGVTIASTRFRVRSGRYLVDLEGGVFSVRVAGEAIQIWVEEGEAHVVGPSLDIRLPAKQSWWPEGTQPPPRELGAVRTLKPSARAPERVLRITKPAGATITLDGVELGQAPLEVVASYGSHDVTALKNGLKSAALVTVAAQGGDVELPEAKPPPLPEVTFEAQDPEPLPEARPLGVEPPKDPSKRYLLARSLAQKGRYAEALALYQGLAEGSSGWAEPSLYEVGRLKLRALKNPGGADAAFAEYRRRYPKGSLAHEVGLSSIEVQLKLGAGEAALQAMDDFLAAFPGSERRFDVRFVRATVRRDRGDCIGAAADYLVLLDDPAHADDALYFLAVCEQQAGNDAAARAHLAEYLKRFPTGAHVSEVRRFFEGAK